MANEEAGVTTGAIPILPSRDLEETSAFYSRFGFRQMGRWADYLIVARDELELHFFAFPEIDPATTIAGCYLRVRNADALHEELAAAGLPEWGSGFPCLGEVEATEYGMREFAATDPNGNLLRVGHRVEEPAARHAT